MTQDIIKEYSLEACCPDWEKAMTRGTDSEGYGALIWYFTLTKDYHIGASLAPVKFCPWCGKEKL